MATVKPNRVEQEVEKQESLRFLFPDAYFVWFLAGQHQGDQQARVRSTVIHDMGRLANLAVRNRKRLVAICTDNIASDVAFEFCGKFQQWRALRVDDTDSTLDRAFKVAKWALVAAKSADMVICYGEPTDTLNDFLDEIDPENPPQLEIRRFTPAREGPGPRVKVQDDPYGAYWQKVERLKRWRRAAWDGKPPLRDFIRPYPTYNIDGEQGGSAPWGS
jgi:hypothetical protein